jgi:hypothetical protein
LSSTVMLVWSNSYEPLDANAHVLGRYSNREHIVDEHAKALSAWTMPVSLMVIWTKSTSVQAVRVDIFD